MVRYRYPLGTSSTSCICAEERRVYGGLSADEAEVHPAAFEAWWLAADPALDAVRPWLEFRVGWSAPPREAAP